MRIQFSLLVILFCGSLFAQPLNDDCLGAINISSIDNYCSQDMEFTNLDATADVGLPGAPIGQGCNHTYTNGVWFTFVPLQPDINVQILSGAPEGTIFDIEPAIFTGNCQSGLEFVDCAAGSNEDFEWLVTGLTLGQRYYLLVSSNDNGGFEGSFKLCINDFIAPPAPEADCDNAVILCDKSTFSVLNLSDVGDDPTEMTGDCIVGAGQQQEQASAWYIWTCDIAGSLTFTITPSNPTNQREDLDFVLYEFPGGIQDCDNRISTRCMLSGETDDGDPNNDSPCFGATGLMEGESDFNEFAGCTPPSNNFLAPLQMVSGVTYGLIVNNFSESGFGFNIEFGGTGTFLGPDPDF